MEVVLAFHNSSYDSLRNATPYVLTPVITFVIEFPYVTGNNLARNVFKAVTTLLEARS